jgi:hypothetical protein
VNRKDQGEKAEPIGVRKEIWNAGVKRSSQANNSAKGKHALQRWVKLELNVSK